MYRKGCKKGERVKLVIFLSWTPGKALKTQHLYILAQDYNL